MRKYSNLTNEIPPGIKKLSRLLKKMQASAGRLTEIAYQMELNAKAYENQDH